MEVIDGKEIRPELIAAHDNFVLVSRHISGPEVSHRQCSRTPNNMPRENRKRGKKHKKHAEEPPQEYVQYEQPAAAEPEEEQAGPSWIVPAPASASFNEEAPFGYVDSEVKAYFRTVDVQIREWQDEPHQLVETEEGDPNEGT